MSEEVPEEKRTMAKETSGFLSCGSPPSLGERRTVTKENSGLLSSRSLPSLREVRRVITKLHEDQLDNLPVPKRPDVEVNCAKPTDEEARVFAKEVLSSWVGSNTQSDNVDLCASLCPPPVSKSQTETSKKPNKLKRLFNLLISPQNSTKLSKKNKNPDPPIKKIRKLTDGEETLADETLDNERSDRVSHDNQNTQLNVLPDTRSRSRSRSKENSYKREDCRDLEPNCAASILAEDTSQQVTNWEDENIENIPMDFTRESSLLMPLLESDADICSWEVCQADCIIIDPVSSETEQTTLLRNLTKSHTTLCKTIEGLSTRIYELETMVLSFQKQRQCYQLKPNEAPSRNWPLQNQNLSSAMDTDLPQQNFQVPNPPFMHPERQARLDHNNTEEKKQHRSLDNEQPAAGKIRTNVRTENPKTEDTTKNITFLENCWESQIGLPVKKATRVKIFNFDNIQFLKGYQRIVTTDQGQYFKLKKTDIDFSVLTKDIDKYGNRGRLRTWSMKGVSVFLVVKPILFPNPLPHRFAVKLDREGTCNWLEVGSYYCHTYQTKVEVQGEFRILQSRIMATKLQDMFKERYYPRRNEFSRGRAQNSPPADNASRKVTVPRNPSRVYTTWQHIPPPQPPMSWVPMAQFPNINPLGTQNNHVQKQVSRCNTSSTGAQRLQQSRAQPPPTYKQVLINKQGPSNQQWYPSHFLPSHQIPRARDYQQHFR